MNQMELVNPTRQGFQQGFGIYANSIRTMLGQMEPREHYQQLAELFRIYQQEMKRWSSMADNYDIEAHELQWLCRNEHLRWRRWAMGYTNIVRREYNSDRKVNPDQEQMQIYECHEFMMQQIELWLEKALKCGFRFPQPPRMNENHTWYSLLEELADYCDACATSKQSLVERIRMWWATGE